MQREIQIGTLDGLAPGERRLAFVDGRSIAIFNIEGTLCAIDNACPHNGAALAGGQLEGSVLRCPAHGLRFDLRTGRMAGAGGLCLTTFPVEAVDGTWRVCIDDPVVPGPAA
ncbi:Rieske 2Fe-2S domain-containing protein [Paraburkholderia sp.]|uniref:Rieske (2Fe-2S) protein n=1 Tax=Paraburkholderia sp. TaxID=1926495 RepID=UPI00286F551D|nr:Rieske 2Fe-2S domain-containing protein [Paraburkholderia sp.]